MLVTIPVPPRACCEEGTRPKLAVAAGLPSTCTRTPWLSYGAGENLAIVVGNAQPDLRDWAMQRQAAEPQLPSGKHRLLLVGELKGAGPLIPGPVIPAGLSIVTASTRIGAGPGTPRLRVCTRGGIAPAAGGRIEASTDSWKGEARAP